MSEEGLSLGTFTWDLEMSQGKKGLAKDNYVSGGLEKKRSGNRLGISTWDLRMRRKMKSPVEEWHAARKERHAARKWGRNRAKEGVYLGLPLGTWGWNKKRKCPPMLAGT